MKRQNIKEKVIFIVGPTASGKTKLAIKLAKQICGEVVSCDSMQVYKGFDILSSKPSKKERNIIRHHLIDIVNPKQNFNVSKFIRLSRQSMEEINKRGKVPIFAGGTGLYVDSLLNGLFDGPEANLKIRNELYRKAKIYGSGYLYEKLKIADPKTAKTVHRHDLRRIIRALEVYKITKKPISQLRNKRKGILGDKRFKIYIFGLKMPREKLYEVINKRVDTMFEQGAVNEARKVLSKRCSKTFRQALGIEEIASFLEGKIDLEKAKELLKRNTRRYAKRQMAWFRRNRQILWLEGGISANLAQILRRIIPLFI